ncbi:MAG: hypothetical protein M5U18_04965 [Dehalococcoidia bacterium]|nr:hypothetical protein [Dehalococcoidia bacterium]
MSLTVMVRRFTGMPPAGIGASVGVRVTVGLPSPSPQAEPRRATARAQITVRRSHVVVSMPGMFRYSTDAMKG